jgi:hypothetical protein
MGVVCTNDGGLYIYVLFLFQLVVHVGVSGIARNLTLEQCAHNDGITMEDVTGRVPPTHSCIEGSANKLISDLQMNLVCDEVNHCGCGVTSVVSHDPGRYGTVIVLFVLYLWPEWFQKSHIFAKIFARYLKNAASSPSCHRITNNPFCS